MKITVDRSTWSRGRRGNWLFDEATGKRCCIGFVCQQIGLTDEELDRVGVVPDMLEPERSTFEAMLPLCSMEALEDAYAMNDERALAEDEREADLIEWGKSVGIEFEFVDGDQT